jgi:diaminopimelate decarboxylase
VLLRLTPGIDPHTYEAVATGKVDSKFGVAIENGQAEGFVSAALTCKNLYVLGYHCHVGSQVFDDDDSVYLDSADVMLTFAKKMQEKTGYAPQILDIGGGYGVRYTEKDPTVDIAASIVKVASHIRRLCEEKNLPVPCVIMEPGRSIVADAGMTLYTAGAMKEITGYKNYLSVDGGMTDNPRYALYGSEYTVYIANKMTQKADFFCDLVGRCCESGDVIQPDVTVPMPTRGDIVAVCTTGAYNYSMASNYNRVARPPVVMLRGGDSYVAVRRETLDDLLLNDL